MVSGARALSAVRHRVGRMDHVGMDVAGVAVLLDDEPVAVAVQLLALTEAVDVDHLALRQAGVNDTSLVRGADVRRREVLDDAIVGGGFRGLAGTGETATAPIPATAARAASAMRLRMIAIPFGSGPGLVPEHTMRMTGTASRRHRAIGRFPSGPRVPRSVDNSPWAQTLRPVRIRCAGRHRGGPLRSRTGLVDGRVLGKEDFRLHDVRSRKPQP